MRKPSHFFSYIPSGKNHITYLMLFSSSSRNGASFPFYGIEWSSFVLIFSKYFYLLFLLASCYLLFFFIFITFYIMFLSFSIYVLFLLLLTINLRFLSFVILLFYFSISTLIFRYLVKMSWE